MDYIATDRKQMQQKTTKRILNEFFCKQMRLERKNLKYKKAFAAGCSLSLSFLITTHSVGSMDEKMLLIAGFKSAKKGKDIEFLISIMNTHPQYIAFYVSVFSFLYLPSKLR